VAEIFYGDWAVEVLAKDAAFSQRFVIAGSAASDGAYPGVPGTGAGVVSGQGWSITMEWSDDAGSGWQPSEIRRSAVYIEHVGLVVDLGADDNVPALRDHDYNDMILRCRSVDPLLDPLQQRVNPYDFTAPASALHPDPPSAGRGDPRDDVPRRPVD
jgi:hypothetical protein